jgi:hypothetical protein
MLLLFYTLALFFFYWALEEDRPFFMLLSVIFFGLAAFERLIAAFFLPIAIIYLGLLKTGWFTAPKGLRWHNLTIYLVPGVALALLLLIATNPAFSNLDNLAQRLWFHQ